MKKKQRGCISTRCINTDFFKELHIFFEATHSKKKSMGSPDTAKTRKEKEKQGVRTAATEGCSPKLKSS